jgi:hypothetical protein
MTFSLEMNMTTNLLTFSRVSDLESTSRQLFSLASSLMERPCSEEPGSNGNAAGGALDNFGTLEQCLGEFIWPHVCCAQQTGKCH